MQPFSRFYLNSFHIILLVFIKHTKKIQLKSKTNTLNYDIPLVVNWSHIHSSYCLNCRCAFIYVTDQNIVYELHQKWKTTITARPMLVLQNANREIPTPETAVPSFLCHPRKFSVIPLENPLKYIIL